MSQKIDDKDLEPGPNEANDGCFYWKTRYDRILTLNQFTLDHLHHSIHFIHNDRLPQLATLTELYQYHPCDLFDVMDGCFECELYSHYKYEEERWERGLAHLQEELARRH